MVKITILGSCRFEPYEILAVPKANELHNTEKGYLIAFKKFKKAMDESDLIICYTPDGIGEHTKRDLKYARTTNATIIVISKEESLDEATPGR